MSNIDRRGILKLLKWECIRCNIYEEIGKGTQCENCPFCKNSSVKKGQPSRVGLKQSVFLPLGLTLKQCQNWGKHQLFMYIYYPELNWQPPPIPDYDNYGNEVNKRTARQTIHHINGDHNDDRKDNITWRLQGDHTRDEQLNFKQKKFLIELTKDCARKVGILVD